MTLSTLKRLVPEDDQLQERILDHLSVVRAMVPEANHALADLIDQAIAEAGQGFEAGRSASAAPAM